MNITLLNTALVITCDKHRVEIIRQWLTIFTCSVTSSQEQEEFKPGYATLINLFIGALLKFITDLLALLEVIFEWF